MSVDDDGSFFAILETLVVERWSLNVHHVETIRIPISMFFKRLISRQPFYKTSLAVETHGFTFPFYNKDKTKINKTYKGFSIK
jgi:hypothetical protein